MAIYKCIICGEEFSRRGKRKALCCSLKCKNKHTSISRTGVPLTTRRGVYKNCEVCGKEKYIHPCKVSASGRVYCSMDCRIKDPNFAKNVTGENNHRWKGGKIKIGEYLYIKSHGHPNGHKQGEYVAEHRLAMEKELGRYLTENEEVHHINQDKENNKIENLELVIKKAHFGKVQCPHCLKQFKIK